MDIPLISPSPPIIMIAGHQSDSEISLTIRCHDSTFKKVTATSSNNPSGKPLFHIQGTTFGTSWSWRRKVFSSSAHIFDFRHHSIDIKNGWIIETPTTDIEGGSKPRILCSLVHKAQVTNEHSAVNATVRTVVGEDVMVVMRSKENDHKAVTSTVCVDGVCFAVIRKEEDNDMVFRGERDRSVWNVRVAKGVDLSLIMVLVLCRAEMGHIWKQ